MRIATVEVERVAIPFVTPHESGAGRWSGLRSAIVTLRTDSGIQGLGEMVPAKDAGRLALADVLVGLDLTDEGEVEAALLGIERIPGDGDAGAGRAARSAVASAIVDTLARADGRSAARMLAPAPRADVAVNALIGRISPDHAASQAGAFVRAGFVCLKVKGGGEPEDAILARLEAVRAAVGASVALRLDLNGSLDEAAAAHLLGNLASVELEYVEQPIAADAGPAALARLRASVDVPIAADESVTGFDAVRELLDAAAVDVLVVKPGRVGGLPEAMRIVELAGAIDTPVVVSTLFETGVGIVTALHLAATVPHERAHGLATAGLLASDLLTRPLSIIRGRMAVPDWPGLGIELDDAAVERYRAGPPSARSGPS